MSIALCGRMAAEPCLIRSRRAIGSTGPLRLDVERPWIASRIPPGWPPMMCSEMRSNSLPAIKRIDRPRSGSHPVRPNSRPSWPAILDPRAGMTRTSRCSEGSLCHSEYGQIVIVSEMTDPNGVNPKDRPSVVVTPTDEIDPEGPVIVIAISTLCPARCPTTVSNCPGIPRRHPRTGLRSRCAAVIPWIQEVPTDRILRIDWYRPW